MSAEPITDFMITPHAAFEMERRGLSEKAVAQILSAPGQRLEVASGRVVLQSKILFEGKEYLVRVFVDINKRSVEVVTAYRTSRIKRYWREEK